MFAKGKKGSGFEKRNDLVIPPIPATCCGSACQYCSGVACCSSNSEKTTHVALQCTTDYQLGSVEEVV